MRIRDALQQTARRGVHIEPDPANQQTRDISERLVPIRGHHREQLGAALGQHAVPLQIGCQPFHVSV
ncbi:MAG: hypothetical protein H0U94_03575 [Acidobacteria bacterium]|nr:hypothetical protein [Acidobacteriota bacterium]